MRSSGAVGSLRARGCLHTGVTRSQTFTRNDAGDRMRPLSRSRSPLGAGGAEGGGQVCEGCRKVGGTARWYH